MGAYTARMLGGTPWTAELKEDGDSSWSLATRDLFTGRSGEQHFIYIYIYNYILLISCVQSGG